MQNHYYTLGLSEAASPEEIKAAFKRLAVKYHPDKHMGDRVMEEKFKAVNEAYQILSDPHKKAQFDLQLQYQRFASTQTQTAPPPYSYQPPRKRYGGRPYYGERKVNHKENNKATLYAFGITFAIALCVIVVKGFYDMYLQKKYEAFLAERREAFNEAQAFYNADDIKNSLILLADLAPFRDEERDMQEYRTGLMEEIMFKGEANYMKRDFENAIRYYELVEHFSPYRPMTMKARLAQSYRYVDQPEESIRKLKELIEMNYRVIPTLVQIAEVYDQELEDVEMAQDYLELAREVAVNDYRARFGNGYMMVLTEEFLPYEHFFLFENLADLYNRINEPEKSLGATNWMKQIWSDSTQSYVQAGRSYELLNQRENACQQYGIARVMGHPDPLPFICR